MPQAFRTSVLKAFFYFFMCTGGLPGYQIYANLKKRMIFYRIIDSVWLAARSELKRRLIVWRQWAE